MIDEAQRRGVRLSVDQSRRHDPLYRWLRDTIRSGELGIRGQRGSNDLVSASGVLRRIASTR